MINDCYTRTAARSPGTVQINEMVAGRYRQGRSYHWGLGASPPPQPPIGPPMILVTVQLFLAIAKILLLNGRFDSYIKMYLYVLLYSFTYFSQQNTDRGINHFMINLSSGGA